MKPFFLIGLLAIRVWASEDHNEGGGARTGPAKAVLEANAERGMRLSEKAHKRLGIKTVRLMGTAPLRVPTLALVASKEEVGVYRLRDGWYKHVEVEVSGKERGSAMIRTGDLRPGDEVVVSGAPLLRVAELDVLGEEAGHDH
jgi:multidrug efflux pump subunit AcrA (membrane-fusion protein)